MCGNSYRFKISVYFAAKILHANSEYTSWLHFNRAILIITAVVQERMVTLLENK